MREVALLENRFKDPNRGLLLAKMRLYHDRIVFRGLGWTGPYKRILALKEVDHLDWFAGVMGAPNLLLELYDGEKVKVWVQGAGNWKFQIEACMQALSRAPRKTDKRNYTAA